MERKKRKHRKVTTKLHDLLCVLVPFLFGSVAVYWSGFFQENNEGDVAYEFYYIVPGLVVLIAGLVMIANWKNYAGSRRVIMAALAIQIILFVLTLIVAVNAPNRLSRIGSIAMAAFQFVIFFLTWARGGQLLRGKRKAGLPLSSHVSQALLKRPERNILFLGRSGSGKTHVLYQLKWKEELSHRDPKFDKTLWNVTNADIRPDPTSVPDETKSSKKAQDPRPPQMGYNNEIIKFRGDRSAENRVFEFWDINGRDRWMWKSFYSRIAFDCVVYFIDAAEYEAALEREINSPSVVAYQQLIAEDRMEFQTLFYEPCLQQAQFFIYLNFHQIDELELGPENKLHAHAILDALEVSSYGSRVKVITNNISGGGGLRSELVHL